MRPKIGRVDKDLNIGEICLYEEDGSQLKCEILDKALKEDGKVLSFVLRVIKVIRTGPFGAIKEGAIMDNTWKRLDCDTPAFWVVREFSQRNFSEHN